VDTTKTITHVGLCAGYGGVELGLKRVIQTLRTVALCEIEAFAIANLVAKMEAGLLDPAPIWTDLKTFPYAEFHGKVDILTGGYPCQPFSSAGKRLGKDDPRHLWPYIADGIRVMRPRVCFFENVEGHISLGLSTVISDLEEMGYSVSWGIFSASEVGAPHQRKRVFILANLKCSGLEGMLQDIGAKGWQAERGFVARCCQHRGNAWPSRPGQHQHAWEPPRVLGNSNRLNWRTQTEGRQHDAKAGSTSEGMGDSDGGDGQWCARREARHTTQSNEDAFVWETKPALGGDADGSADRLDDAELYESCDNRTDELRLLGNGVVPATAEKAFITLINEQNDITKKMAGLMVPVSTTQP
jgi:DNA (cytosine-5)-methyltransferase 1